MGLSLTSMLMALFIVSLLITGVMRMGNRLERTQQQQLLAQEYQMLGGNLDSADVVAGTPAQWAGQGLVPQEMVSAATGGFHPDVFGNTPKVIFTTVAPVVYSSASVPAEWVNQLATIQNMGISVNGQTLQGGVSTSGAWSAPLPAGTATPAAGEVIYGWYGN